MDLIHYGDVLDQDIRRLAGRKPASAMGKSSLELSAKLRDHAIMALLVEDWVEGFSGNLTRSGLSRLVFLEQSTEGETDNPYRCSSFYEPLLDTIAGGDAALAARIAGTAKHAGNACGDTHDFYYSQIVQLLLGDTSRSELHGIAEQFASTKASAPKDSGVRLDICRALIDTDSGAFETAFERLLDHEQASRGKYVEWDYSAFERKFTDFGGFDAVVEVHNGIRTDDESLETFDDIEQQVRRAGRQVCIEALALLQLAESREMQTRESYRFCPGHARHVRNTSFDWVAFLSQASQTSGTK